MGGMIFHDGYEVIDSEILFLAIAQHYA